MIKGMALTILSGMDAVILIGFLVGYLKHTKIKNAGKAVFYALTAGLLFSFSLVYTLKHLSIEKETEVFFTFTGFLLTVIIILWAVYQKYGVSENGQTNDNFIQKVLIFAYCLYLGVLYETHIFRVPSKISLDTMQTSGFDTKQFLIYCGVITGILLLILFLFALINFLRRSPNDLSRRLLLTVNFIYLGKLSIMAVYGLIFVGILPSTPSLISGVAPFYNNIGLFSYFFLFATGVILILNLFIKTGDHIGYEGLNRAEIRKIKARKKKRVFWIKFPATLAGVFILILSANYISMNRTVSLVPAVPLKPVDGVFEIDKEKVNDGKLHRFSYETKEDVIIKFFIIRKTEDAYGVVYDACDICGAAGYYQQENNVICRRCDVLMNKATIGFPGGCNPIPINFRVENGKIYITKKELLKKEDIFRG
ncbi:DUF2318 domain-containing protein [Flexistipes sp.]|uniref:DUF2318 domain-containing protein n=1 Tax=Flexistipes sp. TaxID=3088135 RepID=UPI002E214B0F|nr:DUF2318 domain-containing protein [Flexistipes sp.]